MNEKHEKLRFEHLFYCFVNIGRDTKHFRFFVVPSIIVATYVKAQHKLWLDADPKHSRNNAMRTFRIGLKNEEYPIPTPIAEKYEDNWDFRR